MPTEKGIETIEDIKAKYFPNFGKPKPRSGQDYRFSRKGQAEFKKAAKLQAIKHRELIDGSSNQRTSID
ncbi:hypothetical protein ACNO6G_21105 [Vibrio harveyi]|uniref:hypothetical protein n=1 Tax=Vibrio harveyi TaxID=669 RepID=UPI00031A589B|nr:hypothetical protein [Vibrio harveyi]